MIIKMKAEQAGGHVHVGVWMGNTSGSLGKCGSLCFREDEWPLFRQGLKSGFDARELTIEEITDDK
jgi:hypothetical protein